ncbi:MAG: Lpg1974 family pore-forming outer membrane protein [Gemmataceae bacterium]
MNAEAALVFPRWSGLFVAPVPLADDEDVVSAVVRNSRLNATVSPWLQLGFFRFGSGYGELVFDYRFLASEGSQTVPLLETEDALRLRSRLNLQTFGIDYVRNDIELPCGATVNWNLGGYLQVVFFDTQSYVEDLFQHVSNYFFGAGPRFGVGLTQPLTPGLSLFAHGNAAWMVGYNVTQNFTVEINDPENGVLSGELDRERSIGSPWWAARTGLTWTPARWPTARFQGGYQFEQWYRLGRIGDSRGDLSAHGIFINWELDF